MLICPAPKNSISRNPPFDGSRDSWENWTPGERRGNVFQIHHCSHTHHLHHHSTLPLLLDFYPPSRATVLHLRLPTDQRCSTAPWATGKTRATDQRSQSKGHRAKVKHTTPSLKIVILDVFIKFDILPVETQ